MLFPESDPRFAVYRFTGKAAERPSADRVPAGALYEASDTGAVHYRGDRARWRRVDLGPGDAQMLGPTRALALGLPLTVNVYGDSTGNDAIDWPRRMVTMNGGLASRNPAHSFRHLLWSDAAQGYTAMEQQQIGAAGHGYIANNDAAGDAFTTPRIAAYNTTDVHVEVLVYLDAITSSHEQNIAAMFGSAGQRGWRLYLSAAGGLSADWSTDGTALSTAHTVTSGVHGLQAGAWHWLKWTLDVDNGAGGYVSTISKATAYGSWTQIGQVTGGSTTSVFATTNPLGFGCRGDGTGPGTSNRVDGRLGALLLRSSIDGPIIAGVTLGQMPDNSTTITGLRGETWTTNTAGVAAIRTKGGSPEVLTFNGSHPGSVLSYADDNTRFPKMTPVASDLTIVNYGHNESTEGPSWATAIDTFLGRVRTTSPMSAVMLSIQNPQRTSATNPYRHARRCQALRNYAAIKGLASVDAWQAFTDVVTWPVDLMTDDVHPNATGYDLWAALAAERFAV